MGIARVKHLDFEWADSVGSSSGYCVCCAGAFDDLLHGDDLSVFDHSPSVVQWLDSHVVRNH